jgi:hypothetical protein
MDLLTEMILQMDKHATRQFKVYSSRVSDDEDRKDLRLFDFIRKTGESYDDEKIFKKLYAETDKNAFYRLKNRLISDIGRSVFLHQHQNNDNMLCFYYAAMAYYYHNVNAPRVALYYFKKGEQQAKEIENYGLLDIIYSQIIKLAREIPTINPEVYIKKRKDNRALLNRLSEVEDVLAIFEYKMNTAQNLASTNTPIPELLENTLNEYTRDEELKQSPKVQFGIYFIVSHILLQNKNYPALVEYLVTTYNNFCDRNFFNKSNHQHKLQMLAWIANSAFMNKDHQQSLHYAELLHQEMLAYEKLHYDLFELFYYNILVINFSEINPEKAIALLLSLNKIKSVQQNAYYGAFTLLNLSVMYFKQKQYSQAIVYLNKAYGHEGYKSIDNQVKLRANIGELMIRYDMKEYDFMEYRTKQIQKENKIYLSTPVAAKENIFLQLIQKLADDPSAIRKAPFRTKAAKYLEDYEKEWGKEEVLFRYNEWLANKL